MNMNIPSNSKENMQQPYNTAMQDYTGNRLYPSSKKAENAIEQYSDFQKRKDVFSQPNELSSSQGTLYSVSQRVPATNTSCSSICNGDLACGHDPKGPSASNGWEHEETSNEGQKEMSNEGLSDKHISETSTSASVPSLTVNCTAASCNNVVNEILQGPVIPTCVYLHNRSAIMMEIEDTPTANVDMICQAIVNCDELGLNKHIACQVFTLWMMSPLLEVQLKRMQKPYEIRKTWRSLVEHYSHASYNKQERDEPKLMFQRNVFFPLSLEEKIKDPKILELLYEEAKNNIINARYPCEVAHYIMLGGVQAHIELGPYNPQIHSTHYFREEQHKYLPIHVRKSATWAWLPMSYKNSPEVRLLEHYKRVPSSATNRKLMKKYLEFCWTLPFYGAAFFEGQIEQPVRTLTSLITYHDLPVLVAINASSVYVIDDIECTVLVGLRYEDLSWEFARPSREDEPNCLPCLFLQFMVVENGTRVSKILQVFSRQARLMDGLITQFVNRIKQKATDETDNKASPEYQANTENETRPIVNYPNSTQTISSLSNKLGRLTLATFDENGHCIGHMGSWSYNY
ncbi:putative FERM domain-containing protein FRMD8P1 [Harmonia axyridis]|uniref:putative FERM domain-containing protein FRMD8P1 n=1 Tax=Harmonia axyridis TaxID=115357 RepID=UPI001E276F4E|nr:putative FERM domain-containing protein FRMD8P1 [Harmonia axyridis]XP_045466882.1 putative FERM domain-containing protein FRMD8P1 [Harmonia axyridis]XP_045466890.1 putative FERM domain-containing protein FRMD8P1 [Harmonia axyridis]